MLIFVNIYYGSRNWDTQVTIPTFKFELKYKLPDPRKERIIVARDRYGRIITSRSPEYPSYALFADGISVS